MPRDPLVRRAILPVSLSVIGMPPWRRGIDASRALRLSVFLELRPGAVTGEARDRVRVSLPHPRTPEPLGAWNFHFPNRQTRA
jgi:hypothetical protein